MKGYFHRVTAQTSTRFWINNVTRKEAFMAIEAGAVGCTQNPSYTWKMISDEHEKKSVFEALDKILKTENDDNAALVKLQRELVKQIAAVFMPLYEQSGGKQGYVSIQGDPFREDAETMAEQARFNHEVSPNIMAKIPVTGEGLKVIGILASERIPINATEVIAVRQAIDVCDIYEKAVKGMKDPAPIYISHITGIYDEYLKNFAGQQAIEISPDVLWQAGIAVAKKLDQMMKERNTPVKFIGGGARGLHHFTEMVGADASITINWKGTADELIKMNPPVVQRFLQPVPHSVLDELIEKFEDFRKAYLLNAIQPHEYEHFGPVVLFRSMFESAWEKARAEIKKRRQEV